MTANPFTSQRLHRYLDDLGRDRRPTSFPADEFEAEQIKTAIDLTAAAPGADAPRPEFLAQLHRRLAGELADPPTPPTTGKPTTRRQVIVGTSAAATAAVAAVAVDRMLTDHSGATQSPPAAQELTPNTGAWQRVATSTEVAEGTVRSFDLGSVVGFVRRVDGAVHAVSGVCTHQGCRLWLDATDARLRCPCHSTSFSPTGQLITHQLPIAPKPLPVLQVREMNGVIEVFAPDEPGQRL